MSTYTGNTERIRLYKKKFNTIDEAISYSSQYIGMVVFDSTHSVIAVDGQLYGDTGTIFDIEYDNQKEQIIIYYKDGSISTINLITKNDITIDNHDTAQEGYVVVEAKQLPNPLSEDNKHGIKVEVSRLPLKVNEQVFSYKEATGGTKYLGVTITSNDIKYKDNDTVYSIITRILETLDGIKVYICQNAQDTPKNVSWSYESEGKIITIIGELEADNAKEKTIYLTYNNRSTQDSYDEWIVIEKENVKYWEKIGNTAIDLKGYVKSIVVNGRKYSVETGTTNVILNNYIEKIESEGKKQGYTNSFVNVNAEKIYIPYNINDILASGQIVYIKNKDIYSPLTLTSDITVTESNQYYKLSGYNLISSIKTLHLSDDNFKQTTTTIGGVNNYYYLDTTDGKYKLSTSQPTISNPLFYVVNDGLTTAVNVLNEIKYYTSWDVWDPPIGNETGPIKTF